MIGPMIIYDQGPMPHDCLHSRPRAFRQSRPHHREKDESAEENGEEGRDRIPKHPDLVQGHSSYRGTSLIRNSPPP